VLCTKRDSPQMPEQQQPPPQTSPRKSHTIHSLNQLTLPRRVWDTHTGEETFTIQHNHIVRAVAFPPFSSALLATGGMEKKLRLFDLGDLKSKAEVSPTTTENNLFTADQGFEIGAGIHKGTIKAIVWTNDPNILVTAADDKMIRWWDLRTRKVVQEQPVQGEIGSCEFSNAKGDPNDIGKGDPVLTIAAGKAVYFFGGPDARTHLKTINLPYEVASAALHPSQRKFITGGMKDTWAKVYNYDTEEEIGMYPFAFPSVFLPCTSPIPFPFRPSSFR
jgi:serine-threonine kinase receptor-associated protein